MMRMIRFRIYGRVQMVGFRYFTYSHANRLGVNGYVRNRPDGSVEVVAHGDEAAVDALALLLKQGPSMARVDEFFRETSPDREDSYHDFRIR